MINIYTQDCRQWSWELLYNLLEVKNIDKLLRLDSTVTLTTAFHRPDSDAATRSSLQLFVVNGRNKEWKFWR